MLKKQFIVAALLLIGGAGVLSGCNQAQTGESQVREEPGLMQEEYVEPMGQDAYDDNRMEGSGPMGDDRSLE